MSSNQSNDGRHLGLKISTTFDGFQSSSSRFAPRAITSATTYSRPWTSQGTLNARTTNFSRKGSLSAVTARSSESLSTSNTTSYPELISPYSASGKPREISVTGKKGSPVPAQLRDRRGHLIEPQSTGALRQVADSSEAELVSTAPRREFTGKNALFPDMLAQTFTKSERPSPYPSHGSGAIPPAVGPMSPTLENISHQLLHDMSMKRISTLEYLRKAHEGRVYWFNTLQFTRSDLQKMPYFDGRKIGRRATNYLLLGLSLPTVLDLNSSNAIEFLRALNSLLSEFDSYQQIHPPDGSSSSSLSRARLPQIFKRATGGTGGKGRRTSSAAEIGLPMGNENSDMAGSTGASSSTAFPSGDTDLLPGEEYTYLLTPSIPFDPDFYETFATLCDVLIDCYTKLMLLVPNPRECGPHIAELFTKADGKVRKIIVQGVVKEFEDTSRVGVKNEMTGIGKVVLGGLM